MVMVSPTFVPCKTLFLHVALLHLQWINKHSPLMSPYKVCCVIFKKIKENQSFSNEFKLIIYVL